MIPEMGGAVVAGIKEMSVPELFSSLQANTSDASHVAGPAGL
jgi:hypothetical protein